MLPLISQRHFLKIHYDFCSRDDLRDTLFQLSGLGISFTQCRKYIPSNLRKYQRRREVLKAASVLEILATRLHRHLLTAGHNFHTRSMRETYFFILILMNSSGI